MDQPTNDTPKRGFAWKTLLIGLLIGLVGGTVGLAAIILGAYAFFQKEAVTAMAERKELQPLKLRANLDWTVTDLQGETVNLQTFGGQPILLHFWNPTCVSCIAEIPGLNTLYETFAPQGLTVVAVALHGEEDLSVEVARNDIRFPVYEGKTGTIPDGLRPTGLPTTYFIDAAGFIVLDHRGAVDWSSGDGADFLHHQLNQ